MLRLPVIKQSEIPTIKPINWDGLPQRFMNPGELEALIGLIRTVASPMVIIEFGVNVGRTAKAILREVEGIKKYVGIDVERDYVPSKLVQRGEIPADPGHLVADDARFELQVNARGSLDLEESDLPMADAIFIDGDHSRMVVGYDSVLAIKRIRKGGIIIWHDYHDLGTVDVREVLHDLSDAGAAIKHLEGTWLAFEKF